MQCGRESISAHSLPSPCVDANDIEQMRQELLARQIQVLTERLELLIEHKGAMAQRTRRCKKPYNALKE